jgi:hypothetical protein
MPFLMQLIPFRRRGRCRTADFIWISEPYKAAKARPLYMKEATACSQSGCDTCHRVLKAIARVLYGDDDHPFPKRARFRWGYDLWIASHTGLLPSFSSDVMEVFSICIVSRSYRLFGYAADSMNKLSNPRRTSLLCSN